MGESSACIVRSLTQPISYRNDEEHPLRALTSSVSFGRFTSDTLDWEKWSCFTQNRCLEEVQKLSKPGSVAAMKAYFEAHYKRVGIKKASASASASASAAALPGKENEVANDSPAPSCMNEIHDDSLMVSDLVKSNRDVSFDGTKEKEVPSNEVVFSLSANGCNVMETAPIEGAEMAIEQLVSKENSNYVDSSNQLANVQKHSNIKFMQEEKTPSKGTTNMGALTSSSMKTPAVSSSRSSISSGVSKLRAPVKPTIVVSLRKEDNTTPNNKKTAKDSMEKKRSTPVSLQKSINFVSHAGEASKTSSPILDRIRNSRIIKSFGKLSKDSLTKQAPTRASSHGVAIHNTEAPRQENIRSKILLDRPLCSRRTVDGKLQSLSAANCSASSSASGRKTPSPRVFSSFSFRSEERAAKRKEKLENKLTTKEAEKVHLQAKSKIPPTWPCSPKLRRKPPPSRIQDTTNIRPPWRSSGKMDGSKHAAEKNKQIPSLSISSLPKRNMRENASPNIML